MEYEIEKLENPDWIDNSEESFKKYRRENYVVYEINLDEDSIEKLIQGKKCMVGTINSCEFGIIVSFNNRYDVDKVYERRFEALQIEKENILKEIRQIKSVLHKNKMFIQYISNMKLIVESKSGEEIPVTKETLVGFDDNNEILTARIVILSKEEEKINNEIRMLEKKMKKI